MFNKYIVGALIIAVVAVQGFYYSGKVNTLTEKNNALQAESEGLRVALAATAESLRLKTKTDITQSKVRAKVYKDVQAVVKENTDAAAKEQPVILPSAILGRLRQLVKAGNTSISTAGDSL